MEFRESAEYDLLQKLERASATEEAVPVRTSKGNPWERRSRSEDFISEHLSWKTYFPTYGGRTKIIRFIIGPGEGEGEGGSEMWAGEGKKAKRRKKKERERKKRKRIAKVNKGDGGKEKTAREIKGKSSGAKSLEI